ncbi:MAG: isoprenylcysteine carboxylmethyltransferase family protein [Desulfobacterales bacterium]|nr:isoprenylcysteine carboxylmethyltransferase family protein [Desulfobacterales bacterium]
MDKNRLKKIFGIGPLGAVISVALFALAVWIDERLGHLQITPHTRAIGAGGVALILSGLGLHGWTMKTLQNWWQNDQLCTRGPFRFFRHPMYAAWISVICSGAALILNSWVLVLWVAALHLIWHRLVPYEENMMRKRFGNAYDAYADRTGRFFPRLW